MPQTRGDIELDVVLEDGSSEKVVFEVIEQTRVGGVDYLLVACADDDEAYILRDTSSSADSTAVYEFVEDDKELDALFTVFEELLADEDIDLKK